LRHVGPRYDEETELAENWHRYYDPVAGGGRYYQPEPVLQDPKVVADYARRGIQLNAYAYAAHNPLFYTDPDGLTVYLCKRKADLWINIVGLKHHWLKTDAGEAGMGKCGGGVPGVDGGSDKPYSDTCNNDHSGESARPGVICEEITNVDEACVNSKILKSRATGSWEPLNQCQSYVQDILDECRLPRRPKKCLGDSWRR